MELLIRGINLVAFSHNLFIIPLMLYLEMKFQTEEIFNYFLYIV